MQTNERGVRTDLQSKVIELGGPVIITVDGSIRIIRDAFEVKWRKNLDFAHIQVERYTDSLQKADLSAIRKLYQNYIDEYQKIADPLFRLESLLPVAYSGAAPQIVLAKGITCKFSIMAPFIEVRQKITETFTLNADGSKCYCCESGKDE